MNSHLTPSTSLSRSSQNVDSGKINSSYVTRGTRDMCITPSRRCAVEVPVYMRINTYLSLNNNTGK